MASKSKVFIKKMCVDIHKTGPATLQPVFGTPILSFSDLTIKSNQRVARLCRWICMVINIVIPDFSEKLEKVKVPKC